MKLDLMRLENFLRLTRFKKAESSVFQIQFVRNTLTSFVYAIRLTSNFVYTIIFALCIALVS